MAAVATYEPRAMEGTVLHRLVVEHLETFLREAADRTDGAGLPKFIEREFREFVTCGVLSRGFARVRCGDCAFERLVPFSCKGRAVCPSCGGRRMTERAAHLVDEVLPPVPVRQWVLTFPHRVRYLLAWDHKLCRAVLAVYVRVLLGFQRRRAREAGITDGRSGAVSEDAGETAVDPLIEESAALAGISSTSVQGRVALGPRAGARVLQIGREPDAPWVTCRGLRQAHLEGFDLHANIAVRADDREGLGVPTDLPQPHPSRPPPALEGFFPETGA